jgi:hypothetical protein
LRKNSPFSKWEALKKVLTLGIDCCGILRVFILTKTGNAVITLN